MGDREYSRLETPRWLQPDRWECSGIFAEKTDPSRVEDRGWRIGGGGWMKVKRRGQVMEGLDAR